MRHQLDCICPTTTWTARTHIRRGKNWSKRCTKRFASENSGSGWRTWRRTGRSVLWTIRHEDHKITESPLRTVGKLRVNRWIGRYFLPEVRTMRWTCRHRPTTTTITPDPSFNSNNNEERSTASFVPIGITWAASVVVVISSSATTETTTTSGPG